MDRDAQRYVEGFRGISVPLIDPRTYHNSMRLSKICLILVTELGPTRPRKEPCDDPVTATSEKIFSKVGDVT